MRQDILRILYLKEAILDRELLLPLARPDEQITDDGPRVVEMADGAAVDLAIWCNGSTLSFQRAISMI